jgi:hypothetical protein
LKEIEGLSEGENEIEGAEEIEGLGEGLEQSQISGPPPLQLSMVLSL